MAAMEHHKRSKAAIGIMEHRRSTEELANAADSLAPSVPSQPVSAHSARARLGVASCSGLPRSLDDLLKPDHILCTRLEHMPVSTWNMMRWAAVKTRDLVWMASKVSKVMGVQGTHGLSKLKQLCFNLPTLCCGVVKS